MARIRVAQEGELSEGGQKYVKVAGRGMYVTRAGDRHYVAESACPCPLSGGTLNRVVAWDGAPCVQCDAKCYTLVFDLENGRNVRGYNYAIDVLPAAVEGGGVFVEG